MFYFVNFNYTFVIYLFLIVYRENTNLPYISSFIEEQGCFPKITHTNCLSPLKKSNFVFSLNEETLNIDEIKNSMILFQSSSSKSVRLKLEPHHMEINLPYMISSLKKSVSIHNYIIIIIHQINILNYLMTSFFNRIVHV